MEQIFLRMINLSISASFLIPAVMLIRLILKKFPKWIPCLLWGIVAIRLICPLSLESRFSLVLWSNPIPVGEAHELEEKGEHRTSAEESYSSAESGLAIDNNQGTGENNLEDFLSGISYREESARQNAVTHFFLKNTHILSIIWIVGVTIMLLYALWTYRALRKRVAEAIPYKDNIWVCDSIDSPFILGVVCPRIYVPSSLNALEVCHVISHELVHLRRKDPLWKMLGFILLSVYWFHPLVWGAYILFGKDIELACDETVISEMDLQERKAYANVLLSSGIHRRVVLTYPLHFGEVGIKARVRAVKEYRRTTIGVKVAAIILCIVVAGCFLTIPVKPVIAQDNSMTSEKNIASGEFIEGEKRNELVCLSETAAEDLPGVKGEKKDKSPVYETENIVYEFDGCTVEPRWCAYDGLTLFVGYDVTNRKDDTVEILVSAENSAADTTYEKMQSPDGIVIMNAVIPFACYRPTAEIIFSSSDHNDSKKYCLPIEITEGNQAVSKDVDCHIKLPSSSEDIHITHIDITKNAICLKLDTTSLWEDTTIYGWKNIAKLKNGTSRVLSNDQEPLVFRDGTNLYLRYTHSSIEPGQISEIIFTTEDGREASMDISSSSRG